MKKILIGMSGVALILILVILIMFFRNSEPSERNELYIDNMGTFSTDDGFYYKNHDGFLQFYDYRADQNTIVCNKPNCEHKPWQEDTPIEQRCNAYIFFSHSIFVYNDYLYVVEVNPKNETLRIVKSEMDRSNQSIFAELDCQYIGSYVIKDGILYFASLKQEMEKDESGMPVQTGMSFVAMNSLDISTGKVKELAVMDKHYNASLSILGVDQGRIYSYYSYFEEKFTGVNYHEAKNRLSWYIFDTDTQEMTGTLEELKDMEVHSIQLQNGIFFYGKWTDWDNGDSDIFYYDLETKENKKLISNSMGFLIMDRKLIAQHQNSSQYTIYDIESKKRKEMKQKDGEVHVLAEYEDNFIVASYENGVAKYGHMKKAEYYEGNTAFELLEGNHISENK